MERRSSASAVVFLLFRCQAEKKRDSALINVETNGGTSISTRLIVRQITNISAHAVKSHLQPMAISTENTAAMSAISRIDSEVAIVTREQMENEKHYQATMTIAKNLLNEGIISEEEYCQIDTKFKEQYAVTFSTLFTDINLIKYGSYGNI